MFPFTNFFVHSESAALYIEHSCSSFLPFLFKHPSDSTLNIEHRYSLSNHTNLLQLKKQVNKIVMSAPLLPSKPENQKESEASNAHTKPSECHDAIALAPPTSVNLEAPWSVEAGIYPDPNFVPPNHPLTIPLSTSPLPYPLPQLTLNNQSPPHLLPSPRAPQNHQARRLAPKRY